MLQAGFKNALQFIGQIRGALYKALIFLLAGTCIIWLSVFLYGSFYYAYMPMMLHIKPVHLQFNSCQYSQGLCSYPTANITLTRKFDDQIFARGQGYKIFLDLEMPESPTNQKLGMFMVKINLLTRDGNEVYTSSRAAMLHYKSHLLQSIKTMFFSPLMLIGSAEEKQTVMVELFDYHEEEPTRPVVGAYIEVQSRFVEIYSSHLRIFAHFTGLRYLMFHWPILSAVIGVGTNLFFITVVALLSWYRYAQFTERHQVVVRVGFDRTKTMSIEQRRSQVKQFLIRERQRQSTFQESMGHKYTTGEVAEQTAGQMTRTRSVEELSAMPGDILEKEQYSISERSTPVPMRKFSGSSASAFRPKPSKLAMFGFASGDGVEETAAKRQDPVTSSTRQTKSKSMLEKEPDSSVGSSSDMEEFSLGEEFPQTGEGAVDSTTEETAVFETPQPKEAPPVRQRYVHEFQD